MPCYMFLFFQIPSLHERCLALAAARKIQVQKDCASSQNETPLREGYYIPLAAPLLSAYQWIAFQAFFAEA